MPRRASEQSKPTAVGVALNVTDDRRDAKTPVTLLGRSACQPPPRRHGYRQGRRLIARARHAARLTAALTRSAARALPTLNHGYLLKIAFTAHLRLLSS